MTTWDRRPVWLRRDWPAWLAVAVWAATACALVYGAFTIL